MAKKSRFESDDKVLRFAVIAVIALFVVATIIIVVRAMNPRADVTEGRKVLEELNKADIQAIETQIQELEAAERAADEAWANRSNNEKFAGCLVVGDSITQGLYVYEVLDASLVFAEKGAKVHAPNGNERDGIINHVVAVKPRVLFIALGMNDIQVVAGNADIFEEDYRDLLEKLKSGLPDTAIYVNSVLPARESVLAEQPTFAAVPEFNQRLESLCEEMDLTYIDNTDLATDEYYAGDGIHMLPDYYPNWVNRMAEEAEL